MTDEQSTGAADAPPEGAPRPPLTRSDRHRVVAGVCGGLGRHLDIDPVVFRVVVAVLCLTGGLGLFLYGLAWLIVPREADADGSGRTELQRVLTGRVDGQSVGAVLLTVIGIGVFFSSMGDGDQLFPLMLLGGLVFLAVRYDPERRRRARGRGRADRPGGPYDRSYDGPEDRPDDPDGQLGAAGWRGRFGENFGAEDFKAQWAERRGLMQEHWRAAREEHARARAAGTVPADTPPPGPSGYLWDPRHPERNPYGQGPGRGGPPGAAARPWWQRADLPEGDPLRKAPADRPSAGAPAVRDRRPRSFLGPLGLVAAVGVGGAVWAAGQDHGDGARVSAVLAAALLVLGLTMLVGAKFGRAKGLVVPALLLTVALAGVGATDARVRTSFGDREWAPASAAELQPQYTLGAGDAGLDLRGLDPAGATLESSVRVGAGHLTVLLPPDVDVRLRVSNLIGDVRLPDDEHLSGGDNGRELELHPVGGRASKGTLDLKLVLGVGDMKVVQG
ncbi:PspC domain-containing protein [Kitasatospora sp. NPDC048540]|uniref:PspC domain-containing protein n=1 Tax=unclassified Kitasatospora TaxID=2633591 RepID=UPI00056D705A|nr:PspC domain-containing protein [Kitasatospora sp. MBT63]